jgi:hypothetical protein
MGIKSFLTKIICAAILLPMTGCFEQGGSKTTQSPVKAPSETDLAGNLVSSPVTDSDALNPMETQKDYYEYHTADVCDGNPAYRRKLSYYTQPGVPAVWKVGKNPCLDGDAGEPVMEAVAEVPKGSGFAPDFVLYQGAVFEAEAASSIADLSKRGDIERLCVSNPDPTNPFAMGWGIVIRRFNNVKAAGVSFLAPSTVSGGGLSNSIMLTTLNHIEAFDVSSNAAPEGNRYSASALDMLVSDANKAKVRIRVDNQMQSFALDCTAAQ